MKNIVFTIKEKWKQEEKKNRQLSPIHIIAFSYITIILIGTVLLGLPLSTSDNSKTDFIDAFFTATSATCVTGLVVKETGTYFSDFGHFVIFILMSLGGLGYMTFFTFFLISMGKRINLNHAKGFVKNPTRAHC